MAEIKTINNEELEKVDGGLANAYQTLKKDVAGMIPPDVKEKLRTARGNVEACRILAENGINVETIEKKIANAGFDQIKIGLQEVPDDALEKIAGGFQIRDGEVVCRCGNADERLFSYQFWRSLIAENVPMSGGLENAQIIHRCMKCNTYVVFTKDRRLIYLDSCDFI